MSVALLVFTDGRDDCLSRTITSLQESVYPGGVRDFKHRIIMNDCLDRDFSEWLDEKYRDFDIHHNPRKLGFGGTISRGWALVPEGCEYVFHLEDDFTFNTAIPMEEMITVLDENEHVQQVVLKRQPWNEQEVAAGGIIEQWPEEYDERTKDGVSWCEHRLFFSTNPSLYRRSLTEQGWPVGDGSERKFTDWLLRNPENRFAFYGKKFDLPMVHHIGVRRAGTGY